MQNTDKKQGDVSTLHIVPESVKAILDERLPQEALKAKPGAANLSSINSIFVTERFNSAFGVGGWKIALQFVESKEKTANNGAKSIMVVVKVTFTVPLYDIYYECFGGNDNSDYGDAFKGATTDAITKIGSWLGVGADIWKNKQSHTTPPQQPKQPRNGSTPPPQQPAEKKTVGPRGSDSYNRALKWLEEDREKHTLSQLQKNYIIDAKTLADLAIDAKLPIGGGNPSSKQNSNEKETKNEQQPSSSVS